MPKNTIGKWGEELNSPQSAAIFIARCASPTASRLNARTIAYSLSHPKCTENGCLERFLDAMILSGKALLRTKRLPLTAKKPPKNSGRMLPGLAIIGINSPRLLPILLQINDYAKSNISGENWLLPADGSNLCLLPFCLSKAISTEDVNHWSLT